MTNTNSITAERVIDALSRHIGRGNGISVGNLVYEITGEAPTPAAERKLRHQIKALRLEGYHICAHPASGYYLAADEQELNETCSFLVERSMSALKQVSSMKRVSLPDLYGQLKLPN